MSLTTYLGSLAREDFPSTSFRGKPNRSNHKHDMAISKLSIIPAKTYASLCLGKPTIAVGLLQLG